MVNKIEFINSTYLKLSSGEKKVLQKFMLVTSANKQMKQKRTNFISSNFRKGLPKMEMDTASDFITGIC